MKGFPLGNTSVLLQGMLRAWTEDDLVPAIRTGTGRRKERKGEVAHDLKTYEILGAARNTFN